jgi:CubicO group peptidase (beta-lactamase class C family)
MKKFRLFFFILLFLVFKPAPAQKASNGDIEAKVDAYVKPYLQMKAFSGSILIARKGRIVFSKGYGMANYELNVLNTPQTRFHIASISKPFTGTAIMILAERGLLSVTDPLAKYIPDYPNGDKITIHHLLTHMSGVPNVNDFPDYNNKSRFPQTLASIIAMFKDRPLAFQPGGRYSYSNSNYNLLAFIIEKVSGKSYGDFLKQNIFDPLGMRDTAHPANAAEIIPNSASGYVPAGTEGLEKAPYLDWTIKTGNGSLYSTVEDLYRWDRALYTEKVLKKATLEKMFTAHAPGVGYGWFMGTRFDRKVIRMSGRSPGFQGEIHRYVDDDVCVIVLGNNYSGTASFMINDIAAIALGEKYEMPEPVGVFRVEPKQLDLFVGRYQSGEDFFRPNTVLEVKRQGDYLGLSYWGNPAVPLTPRAEAKFFDRTFGGGIKFVKNERGEITHMLYEGAGSTYQLTRIKER